LNCVAFTAAYGKLERISEESRPFLVLGPSKNYICHHAFWRTTVRTKRRSHPPRGLLDISLACLEMSMRERENPIVLLMTSRDQSGFLVANWPFLSSRSVAVQFEADRYSGSFATAQWRRASNECLFTLLEYSENMAYTEGTSPRFYGTTGTRNGP
jgi:hypothetical protein